ncbi:histidine kinase [Microbacterium sp. HD4P20]|uniref:sensor histidine kinase n=1 Tax=Microbacterium sp. HD4P20 TaxID=2864874 RepID=UPI001C63FE24|nr:histidine kinase [Microbacterium sp. HD4P20]MCP2638401.1 histidine kinase [Microbacterium sp. HD4P20]
MLRAGRARRGSWSTPLGVVLLLLATSVALPLARWGDSALVLALIPAAVAGYLAGRHMVGLVPAVITFSVVLAGSLPVSYLMSGTAPLDDWMASVLIALLTAVAPWWFGRFRMLRDEQRKSDAAILADRAQADERARIADDLHDTIGHELALIAVQAGALELGRDLSPKQREQFRELREAAVRASGRLRDVVRMTRPEDGPSRLDPLGGEGIDALVAGARDAGMNVEARIDHAVVSTADPLIAELALRTVREGLTNAARHAPGAAVVVDVAQGVAGGVTVSITSAASTETGVRGSGHGIPSLRRRAELLGGSIDAGVAPDGGFELRLRAPMRAETLAQGSRNASDPALRSNARAARRRVWQATIVPAVILGLVLVGFVAIQAITFAQTALTSEVYEGIELGTTRAELAPRLPSGIPGPVPVVFEPTRPDGSQCEYFAARDGWLHFTDATYRLCFDQGVLVEKTLLGAS